MLLPTSKTEHDEVWGRESLNQNSPTTKEHAMWSMEIWNVPFIQMLLSGYLVTAVSSSMFVF